MSKRLKVFGIPCPVEDVGERLTVPYRIWFFAYRNNQVLRHKVGLHQKPRGYSIAPRCDWCGKPDVR